MRRYWTDRSRVLLAWACGAVALGFWSVALVREVMAARRAEGGAAGSPPYPLPPREIPFPAVTVCPSEPVVWGTPREVDLSKVEEDNLAVRTLCSQLNWDDEDPRGESPTDPPYIEGSGKQHKHTSLKKLNIAFPSLEDVVANCTWKGQPLNCSKEFQGTMTSDGLCFTFNALPLKDMIETNENSKGINWKIEGGYPSDQTDYPRRWEGSLRLWLASTRASIAETDLCGKNSTGHKVFFHNPSDILNVNGRYIEAPFFQETMVTVEPRLEVHMRRRQGWFRNSGCIRLDYPTTFPKYFLDYSQAKCRRECLIDRITEGCHCLPLGLQNQNATEICGPDKKQCIEKQIDFVKEGKRGNTYACDCFPECWSLTYRMDVVNIPRMERDGAPYSIIEIRLKEIDDVIPKIFIPISADVYGSTGSVLFISGVCLILYLWLMVIVSNQERIRFANTTEMRPAPDVRHAEETVEAAVLVP